MFEEWVSRNLLRRWRAETCLSLRQAAEVLGVSFATVSQWERGRKVPRPAHFRRLAALTGLSLAGLAGEWHRWLQEKPDSGRPARRERHTHDGE